MDRREAHEERPFREGRDEVGPDARGENGSAFESVLSWGVVVNRGRVAEPLDRGKNGIALGRMLTVVRIRRNPAVDFSIR
jgi:hypothetical protein